MKADRATTEERELWPWIGGIVVTLLAAAVFTLGSLNVPLRPERGSAFVVFFALSTLLAAALLVFALILARSLVRLWAERRSGQMGSRFKVKMVLGAMGVSLLPSVFFFFFSYAIVNRTLIAWFPRPLEIANEQSQRLLDDMAKANLNRPGCHRSEGRARPASGNQSLLGWRGRWTLPGSRDANGRATTAWRTASRARRGRRSHPGDWKPSRRFDADAAEWRGNLEGRTIICTSREARRWTDSDFTWRASAR